MFDVSKMQPVESKTVAGAAANPWADEKWPFNVSASYEKGKAYELVFPGQYEKVPAKRGENKGKLITKLTGEAGQAEQLIRQAAVAFDLGVSVSVTPVTGKEGFYTVTWRGQKKREVTRKAKTTPATGATTQPAPAKTTPAKAATR